MKTIKNCIWAIVGGIIMYIIAIISGIITIAEWIMFLVKDIPMNEIPIYVLIGSAAIGFILIIIFIFILIKNS